MHPPPLTSQPEMHHLPRLDPRYYRGFAAVLWTITFERRACGWLDPAFHAAFRALLLHAAAREQLFCPAYVLMPDHIHLFWLGLKLRSGQRSARAVGFLRQAGFSKAKNLAGGILAWADRIDPKVPKY